MDTEILKDKRLLIVEIKPKAGASGCHAAGKKMQRPAGSLTAKRQHVLEFYQ
ncbi:MAG: hypothetical protein JSW39_14355 [Desulfobacterales bacterium]|nr:MAG: hypothetical protein JSW39_14355 [Desulfobacterales bacterium]